LGQEDTAMKQLRCGDIMPGCQAVIEGQDEAEVMRKGAEHAKNAHGLSQIPPDVGKKVQLAIKDKK
jgi:predicted small metal-binding protein